MFCNSTITDLFLFVFTQLILHYQLKTNTSIDENIQELNQAGYLSHVNKNESGSPEAEIIYNIEIKEGSYREWP